MTSPQVRAVIMAGGSGTRLWPMSRTSKPKQFQVMYGDSTLLQETARRLEPLVGHDELYIIANQSHEASVTEQLEWLPKENFVGEPVGKNTATKALAAHQLHVLLSAGNPEATQAAPVWRSVG